MKKSCFRNYFKVSAVTIFLCFILLLGCANNIEAEQEEISLQQKPTDLLAGTTTAISYSGFRHGQHPDLKGPNDEEMLEDLKILTRNSNFKLIRLYGSGEGSQNILKLIRVNNLNVKVMLGAWLNAEISNHEGCSWLTEPIPQDVLDANKKKNAKEVENAIILAKKYPDIVVAVNVGNEVRVNWSDHIVGLESLISYVRKVKSSIKQPVTIADNYMAWVKDGPTLAKELDFITVHTYPIWEGKDINEAMPFSIQNVTAVKKAIPDSRIVIGETGWASISSEFGVRASEEKQKRFYDELIAWATKMNITTFIFEAFDEDWKGDPNNALAAEKHWGIFTIDRKAKLVMYEKYPDLKPAK